MALGLRMYHARTVTGEVLPVSKAMQGQSLSCEGCRTPVVYNSEYTRGDGIKVGEYLRLAAGSRHEDMCKYNASHQIGILCGLGVAIEEADRPLVALANNRFELRLALPGSARAILNAPLPPEASTDEFKLRVARVWSGASLAPYCRSAAGIARIAAALEGQSSLAATMVVKDRGRSIPWRNFFFGENQGDRLLEYLESKGYKKNKHPVAVLVRPRKIENDPNGIPRAIRCRGEQVGDLSKKVLLMPWLNATAEILNSFELEEDYVVFGQWWIQGKRKVPDPKRNIFYENIAANVYQPAQVAKRRI